MHRDLKPENILLTRDGRAKILDFGLARMTQASGHPDTTMPAPLTGPGVVMGTVGYMSPEQVRGLDADHRSDIFSFGVVLHEMLGGARPFEGETAVDTMQAILREDAPDLPSTVPAGVRQVVSHCLEKDPAHRFQSARDLGFALRALAQGDSTSGSAPAVASPAPPAPRTRAWLAAGVALLAIAATALITRELTRAPAPTTWSAEQLGGPAVALHPRRSPDGRLLAFQAMVDGTTQVGVMDPESGNWNVLTSRRDLGIVEYLCWSPDGSTIYFSRTLDVPMGVFSVPFLGGEERLVIENAAHPAALPDGSLLVARRNDEGRTQLTRVWPDTGRMQALPVDVTFDPGFRPWIRVSADGRRVVVALGSMYDTPGKRSLIEVDVAAGTAHPIEVEGNPEIRAVALSADGASAIAAVPANALTRIVRVPLDGPRVPEDLVHGHRRRLGPGRRRHGRRGRERGGPARGGRSFRAKRCRDHDPRSFSSSHPLEDGGGAAGRARRRQRVGLRADAPDGDGTGQEPRAAPEDPGGVRRADDGGCRQQDCVRRRTGTARDDCRGRHRHRSHLGPDLAAARASSRRWQPRLMERRCTSRRVARCGQWPRREESRAASVQVSGCSCIPLAPSSWPGTTARRCACSRSRRRTERSAPSP